MRARHCPQIFSVVVVASLLAALSGCDNSPTEPSTPLNLTGTWSGLYGPSASGTALRLTWVATQTDNTVSGTATLVKPTVGVQARGALTGTLNGNRISLAYAVPIDSLSGFPACSISGFGEATATNTSIAGQFAVTFNSCAGTGLEPPGNNDLMFTRVP